MSELTPPKLANRFLRWFCAPEFLEEVQGDLEEMYEEDTKEIGVKKANARYWRNVSRHLRPIFIRKGSIQLSTQNQTAMWSNYLKIALRNFWRSKVISSINVIGLSLGLASCLIVFFHIQDELSYDKFIENGDDIYRVLNVYPQNQTPYSAGGPIPLGPTLLEEFAGIKDAVRLWRDYQPTLKLDNKVFTESNLIFTDVNFFEMMSFALSEGNPETALSEPNTVIFTRSMVKKYFGDENAMGKTVSYDGGRGQLELKITGVMEDLPHNTHFQFDFLVSFLTVKTQLTNWGSFKPIWTYITLNDGVEPADIRSGMPAFAEKYVPGRVRDHEGFTFEIEPLADIYMKSKSERNMKPLGDIQAIYVFGIVGASILLIACINFINLSMAKSLSRAKEVGIRKTIGAKRGQLISQFITESGLTVILSLIVAMVLAFLFLPVYNAVTGKEVLPEQLFDLEFILIVGLLLMLVSLVAGIYPAIFISRMKATSVLKKSLDQGSASLGMRKIFVVFQFLISAVLIIGILVTKKQLNYMYSKPLGIDKENVMVIPFSRNDNVLLDQLKVMPEVVSVGVSQRLPVNTLNYDGRTFNVEGKEEAVTVQSCVIDEGFVETYGIEIIEGRNHFEGPATQWEFLINERAVKDFGWVTPENALGKNIFWSPKYGIVGKVIGVFKDYHLESLHEEIPPMVMFKNADAEDPNWHRDFISIKYQSDDLSAFAERVEHAWTELNPDRAYFNVFIDDSYRNLHEADHRFATIFNYVTFIAMLIACLGLLGLSMLTVNQKTKEIGIRKALGASVFGVSKLLSTNFLRLILVGLILASPLAYYLMENWLSGFSYRINIGVGQFFWAFLSTIVISLVTIGFQTVRAAMANPAYSLRDE